MHVARRVLAMIGTHAAASPGVEVCGLLYGRADAICDAEACANVDESPTHAFEIDPAALIAAYRRERAGGARIVGCYHSHPSGVALPSRRDAAAAGTLGWLWLIAGGEGIEAYRVVEGGSIHGRFEPVTVISDGDGSESSEKATHL